MIGFPYKIEQCVWELTRQQLDQRWRAPSAPNRGELSVTECLRVAEQLIEQGCRHVTLIGDAVLDCEGWDRIARRLNDAGVRVDAITRATRVGREQFAQLRRARVSCVGVAIDGLAGCHDRLRGRAGAFRQAIELAGALLAEGFSVMAVTTITDAGADDLPALYDLLAALGVGTWQLRLAPASPTRVNVRRAVPPARLAEVARFVADKEAERRMTIHAASEIGCVDDRQPAGLPKPGAIPVAQGCQAGLKGVGIDSRGNVKGCQALADRQFVEGNLRTQTLAEIWRRPGAFAYNRRFHPGRLQGRCTGCDLGDLCRAGCRSLCFFTTGKLFENPYCIRHATPVPVRLVPGKAAEPSRPRA